MNEIKKIKKWAKIDIVVSTFCAIFFLAAAVIERAPINFFFAGLSISLLSAALELKKLKPSARKIQTIILPLMFYPIIICFCLVAIGSIRRGLNPEYSYMLRNGIIMLIICFLIFLKITCGLIFFSKKKIKDIFNK